MKKQALFIFAMFIALGSWGQIPNWAWSTSASGTGNYGGTGISTDVNGNIIVTGLFSSPTITFGATTLSNNGSYNFFVVKYDPSGNLLWAKSAGGTGNDNVYGISTDASGNIVVTGWYDSPIITFGTTTLTSSGLKLIFVSKLSATTGLELYSKDEEMLVSPNPFNNATHIQLPESVQNAEITVCDLLGKKVLSKKCSGKECLLEKGTMNTGVYFMHINDEQRQYPITKIVVQ